MVDDLTALYQQGHSFGQIAEATGRSVSSVKYHLTKSGVHTPNRRGVTDGRADCKECLRNLPVSEFDNLANSGCYICTECRASALHERQIAKLGCSREHYEALLKAQQGKCAICGAANGHTSKHGTDCRLAVDHDHRTGTIRGLLCNSCNRGLGRFKDSLELLRAAVRYLEERQ